MIKLFRFVLALAALSCAVYWYRPGRGQYAPGPNDLGICYSVSTTLPPMTFILTLPIGCPSQDGRCRVIAFIAKGDAYGAATIKEGCGSMTSLKGPVATVCK